MTHQRMTKKKISSIIDECLRLHQQKEFARAYQNLRKLKEALTSYPTKIGTGQFMQISAINLPNGGGLR